MGCSSLTLATKDDRHFLARTMDFTLDPGSCLLVLPRGQHHTLSRAGNYTRIQYTIMGMGTQDPRQRTLYDGVNENGIIGAALYYPEAVYSRSTNGLLNPINPMAALIYLLGNSSSLVEVRELAGQMTLTDEDNQIIGPAPPLHFFFSDRTGSTLVIEPDEAGLSYHEQTVGVLTNAPCYPWQETNLRNYIGVHPWPVAPIHLEKTTLLPFGQGSGTWGLPGDYTSPSRFVRVAFMKYYVRQGDDELDGMNQCMQILSSVNIPQGAVLTQEGYSDYTRYTCAICAESLTYYFYTYECRRITAVTMTQEMAMARQLMTFPWPDSPKILWAKPDLS